MFTRAAIRRVTSSVAKNCRKISSTQTKLMEEVRHQTHPGEILNPTLSTPHTVAVIGAPMTRTYARTLQSLDTFFY